MPRPLFTANRQSANTLIWRRFDPFRPYRLLLWLIAAPIGYGYTATLLALYAKNLGGVRLFRITVAAGGLPPRPGCF